MVKIKTIVILIIIYLISFLAIKTSINFFEPFYFLKDIIYFPVKAKSDLSISRDLLMKN